MQFRPRLQALWARPLTRKLAAGTTVLAIFTVIGANDAEAQRVVLKNVNQIIAGTGLAVTPPIRTNPNAATGATVTVSVANGGIGATQLAHGAVNGDKLVDGAVTSTKIANGAVGTAQIADGSITSAKLNNLPVVTLDTAQTISGGKTFTAPLTQTSGGGSIVLNGGGIGGVAPGNNFFLDAASSSSPGLAAGTLFLNYTLGNGGVAFGNGTNSPTTNQGVVGFVQANGTYILGRTAASSEAVTVPAFGSALVFRGAPNGGFDGGENSDPLWMARFNTAGNSSELRTILGDDPGSTADAFVIGTVPGGTFNQTGAFNPVIRMNAAGQIIAGNSITQFGAASDRRLKQAIAPLPDDTLDRVVRLRGVSFRWADAYRKVADFAFTDRKQIGVIAQEVEREFPELVTTAGTGKDAYKTVDYGKLTAVLLEAVKELNAKNTRLEAAVARRNGAVQDREVAELRRQGDTLRAENDRLEARLAAMERAVRAMTGAATASR